MSLQSVCIEIQICMVCIAYNVKVIIPSSSLVCTHTWTQALILLADTRTEKNLLRKVFEGQSAKVVFWTHNLVTLRTKGLAAWWLSGAIQSISETAASGEQKNPQAGCQYSPVRPAPLLLPGCALTIVSLVGLKMEKKEGHFFIKKFWNKNVNFFLRH